jgi:hypothetical protein
MKLYIAKRRNTWGGFVATDSGRIREAALIFGNVIGEMDLPLVKRLEREGYEVNLERKWSAEDWSE